jgi:hypothetical protein
LILIDPGAIGELINPEILAKTSQITVLACAFRSNILPCANQRVKYPDWHEPELVLLGPPIGFAEFKERLSRGYWLPKRSKATSNIPPGEIIGTLGEDCEMTLPENKIRTSCIRKKPVFLMSLVLKFVIRASLINY